MTGADFLRASRVLLGVVALMALLVVAGGPAKAQESAELKEQKSESGAKKSLPPQKPEKKSPSRRPSTLVSRGFADPTLDQLIGRAFANDKPALTRYADGLRDIRVGQRRLLLVLGDPQADRTRQLLKIWFQGKFDDQVDNYWLVPLHVTGKRADDTKSLATALKIKFPDKENPALIVIDEEGKQLAIKPISEFAANGVVDKEKFRAFLKQHAPEPLDARKLLDEALAKAKLEYKRVIVLEGSIACGPCLLLERFLDEQAAIFSQDYIVVKLDHRWTHTKEIMKELRAGQPGGVPWYVILDSDGKKLINSVGPDGNIGFPTEANGISHFDKMLTETRIRLTDEDLARIRSALYR